MKTGASISNGPVTRPSLLVRIRDLENQRAWEEFVEIYTPLVYGYCRSRGLQDGDAADVAQETMRAVTQAIGRFEYDPQRGKFRDWLLTVVRSKLNNFLAKQQQQPATADTALLQTLKDRTRPNAEFQWECDYRRRLFEWAAQKVQSEVQHHTWQAFWQTAIEDRSGREVANRLGLNLSSVYAARSRVLARLREVVAEVDGDDSVFAETTK